MKNSPLISKLLEVRELLTKGVLCDFLPTVLLFRNGVWNPSESGFSEIVHHWPQVEISNQNSNRGTKGIGTFFSGPLSRNYLRGESHLKGGGGGSIFTHPKIQSYEEFPPYLQITWGARAPHKGGFVRFPSSRTPLSKWINSYNSRFPKIHAYVEFPSYLQITWGARAPHTGVVNEN